jgi:hypothetical protein
MSHDHFIAMRALRSVAVAIAITTTTLVVLGWYQSPVGVAAAASALVDTARAPIRIGVYTTRVAGEIEPNVTVTATLSTRDGTYRGQGVALTDAGGHFDIDIYYGDDAADVPIQPGDILVVSVRLPTGATDELRYAIPSIIATTDSSSDTVSGAAPPGADVTVAVGGDPDGPGRRMRPITQTVQASADGQFAVGFYGKADIQPGMGGMVVVRSGEVEFVTAWASTSARLLGSRLVGTGPAGRRVEATVDTGQGAAVAHAVGYATRSQMSPYGAWQLVLMDDAGKPLSLRVGFRIRIRVGDDDYVFVVPEIIAVRHLGADVIAGRTTPGAQVLATIGRAGARRTITCVVGTTGLYTTDKLPEWDLVSSDYSEVAVILGALTVVRRVLDPGVSLDLDAEALMGSVDQGASVSIIVTRGDITLRQIDAVVDQDGEYLIPLSGVSSSLHLMPGDRIHVVGVMNAEVREIVLPVLTLEFDLFSGSPVVRGMAMPGGLLTMLGLGSTGLVTRSGKIVIEADGTFRSSFIAPHDLDNLVSVTALYQIPSGHLLLRSVQAGQPIAPLLLPRLDVSRRNVQ